jgi:single-strand DNA-binding protein|tara:strand:- start:1650 stop:2057 length:408 start_codon:yes stop_codon:yes gene_type:complete
MLNQIVLIGRLGADPETRKTNSGTEVHKMRIATDESFRKNDEWQTETQWHNVVFFGEAGKHLAASAKKGELISVVGKVTYREHEGKYYTDVVAQRGRRLNPPKRDEAGYSGSGSSNNAPPVPGPEAGDGGNDYGF